LEAAAAAKHRQQVQQFLVAAAAHRVKRTASVPTVSRSVSLPSPPVTRAVAAAATPPAPATPVSVPVSARGQGGLPLPIQYLQNGTVDQGVDYAAPGGTPLFAMGPGTIIRAGMGGFGPDAPVLHIAAGPLAGRAVYYGHAGQNLVPVGARVAQGQQISTVGNGRVGISTGPHLEIGFYPPGPNGAGQAMLKYINSAVGHSTGG
ncbi:MAG TPA: M23 family metallopeptidase, partial [Acidimicrobiales bacterium]